MKIETQKPFHGSSGVLYDTLTGFEGSSYTFSVEFLSNGSRLGVNPMVTFDGTGNSSGDKNILVNQKRTISYQPSGGGLHSILLYWNNQTCGFYPKDKILIRLFVKHIKSPNE